MTRVLAASIAFAMLCAGCAPPKDELTLFVAASVVDLAKEWQADCARQGIEFSIHSSGSLLLVHQVAAGARADFLLAAGRSALEMWPEEVPPVQIDSAYLQNRMVVVTRPGVTPPATLEELSEARFDRIVVADFELAPAGRYAKEALEGAGLWEALSSRIIKTGDVRMALAAVRTGSADAGFVYVTDLATAPALSVADLGAADPFATVDYPLVMLSPETPRKRSMWAYLHSEAARTVARKYGFLP